MRLTSHGHSALLLALLLLLPALPVRADLRNSFPGKRVKPSTRGECFSRSLIHLVPIDSTYAPPSDGRLAMLQGPSGNPFPLVVTFRPYGGPDAVSEGAPGKTVTLDAAPASLTLIPAPSIETPMVWESTYQCTDDDAGGGMFGFVQAVSPPAETLLLNRPSMADQANAADLAWVASSCGGTVAAAEVARRFAIEDLVTADWPDQLPVRCLDQTAAL
ncbi:hypothetical protein EVJ50_11585 [Synechococcus sp. RSCCF101]|uniref:hypothetical protein n=1 Tax=Synechococcus sp. RSCCF101 TaxID=2511069 RepID=UPI00124915F5|nr:hypothetical protein [Synechococcus sp. RSCCF101]QEY32774.1 hypothetical protein EVJ50_11585 [Synechococcus sp. RSCCF101]